MNDAIVWHDVENGGYRSDLALWRELAQHAGGPVLDLGAGTGRVALDLAEAGHEVTALDADPAVLDELARRARERGLEVECVRADARNLGARRGPGGRRPLGRAVPSGWRQISLGLPHESRELLFEIGVPAR